MIARHGVGIVKIGQEKEARIQGLVIVLMIGQLFVSVYQKLQDWLASIANFLVALASNIISIHS